MLVSTFSEPDFHSVEGETNSSLRGPRAQGRCTALAATGVWPQPVLLFLLTLTLTPGGPRAHHQPCSEQECK